MTVLEEAGVRAYLAFLWPLLPPGNGGLGLGHQGAINGAHGARAHICQGSDMGTGHRMRKSHLIRTAGWGGSDIVSMVVVFNTTEKYLILHMFVAVFVHPSPQKT